MTGRRIAVIGGGISGLTAGYVLSRTDHVTLFEADRRLGGHADTHLVGAVPVDTGFIVYNERTYPLLTRLFAELGVSTQASEMSMSVSCAGCGLHYAGKRGPAWPRACARAAAGSCGCWPTSRASTAPAAGCWPGTRPTVRTTPLTPVRTRTRPAGSPLTT